MCLKSPSGTSRPLAAAITRVGHWVKRPEDKMKGTFHRAPLKSSGSINPSLKQRIRIPKESVGSAFTRRAEGRHVWNPAAWTRVQWSGMSPTSRWLSSPEPGVGGVHIETVPSIYTHSAKMTSSQFKISIMFLQGISGGKKKVIPPWHKIEVVEIPAVRFWAVVLDVRIPWADQISVIKIWRLMWDFRLYSMKNRNNEAKSKY